jgi:predicted alpha/beta superfamily hydrolase
MRFSLACCGALAALMVSNAVAAQAPPLKVVADAPAMQPDSQRFVLRSARLGHDVLVVVSKPQGPLATSGRKLPSVYVLDGGYWMTGPVAQLMTWSLTITPAYVVSIGYPEDQPGARDADLLFRPVTLNGRTSGGQAAAFERFLLEELRPFLGARYPMDAAHDILFGHSFGGLFVANVLSDRPDAFGGYVAASPSVWADPQVLAHLRAAAARGGGRKVFVAVGDAEEPRMIDGAAQVAGALSGPGSTWKVEQRTFAGPHIGYYPELVPAALRALLPMSAGAGRHTAIELPGAALDRVVGVYVLADGRTITVTHRTGKLYALLTGSPEGTFQPETKDRFFTGDAAGFDITLTFEGAPDRAPEAVVLSINGAATRAPRRAAR